MSDPQSTGATHQKAAPPVPKVEAGAAHGKKRKQSVQAVRRPASEDQKEGVAYVVASPDSRPAVVAMAEAIAETADVLLAQAIHEGGSEEQKEAFLAGMRKAIAEKEADDDDDDGVETEVYDSGDAGAGAGWVANQARKACANTLMRVAVSPADSDSDGDEIKAEADAARGTRTALKLDDADWAALWVSKLERSTVGRKVMEHLAHMAALMDTNEVPTECPIAQVVDWRRAYCYALRQPLATPWGMPHHGPKYVLIANLHGDRHVFYGTSPMLFQMFAHTPPVHGAPNQGVEGMKELIKFIERRSDLRGLMTYSMVFQGGYNSLYWDARSIERKDDGTVVDGHMCLRIDEAQPAPATCTSALETPAAEVVVQATWQELEAHVKAHDMDALSSEQFEDDEDHHTWVSERVDKCRKIIAGMQVERKKMEAVHQAREAKLRLENERLGKEVDSMQSREATIGKLCDKVESAVKLDNRLERKKKETELEQRKLRRDKKQQRKGGNGRAKVEEEEEPPDPPLAPPQGMTHSEHWRMCADKIAWLRERLDDARGESASAQHELAERNRRAGEADLDCMQERDNAQRRVKELEVLLSSEKQRADSAHSRASNANRDLDLEKGRLADANRKTIDNLERKVQDAQMQERTARAEAEQVVDKLGLLDRQLDGKDAEKAVLDESIHEHQRTIFRLKCAILAAGAKYDSRLDLLKEARMQHAEAAQALTETRKEAKAKVGGLERARAQAVAKLDKQQGELAVANGAIDDLRRELGEVQAVAAASDAEKTLAEKALADALEAVANAADAGESAATSSTKKKKKKGPPPSDCVSEGESTPPAAAEPGQPSALMRMQMELGEVTARMVRAEDELKAKAVEALARVDENEQLRKSLQAQTEEAQRMREANSALSRKPSAVPDEGAIVRALEPGPGTNPGLGSPGVELVIKQMGEHLQLLTTLARRTDRAEMAAGQAQTQCQMLQAMVPFPRNGPGPNKGRGGGY